MYIMSCLSSCSAAVCSSRTARLSSLVSWRARAAVRCIGERLAIRLVTRLRARPARSWSANKSSSITYSPSHHEELASEQKEAIRENTELTKLIQLQTAQIRVLATLARQMAAQVGLPPAQIEALMAVPERAEGTAPIQEAGT
jgi:hypothetical protein